MSVDYGNAAAVAKLTRAKVRSWTSAYIALKKASRARAAHGPHSTRARLTTANARYARAAEDFDRKDADLREWSQTVDPVDVDALKSRVDAAIIGLHP